MDNNNDGLPDCNNPPPFNKVLTAWKCGTNPQQVWIVEIGSNGECTSKCVLYSDFIANRKPNQFLGKCIECPGNLNGHDEYNHALGGEESVYQINPVRKINNEEGVDFKIVPNPNYGIFDLVFDTQVEEGSIRIFNLLNQEVWTSEISDPTNVLRINSFEFRQRASGLYRVMFKNKSGKTLQTLLIMK